MRVLLTGGTGFIGPYVVRALLERGHEVALLVREDYAMGKQMPASLAPLRAQLQLVYADLRNFVLTARALREAQPEAVLHLAAVGATAPFLPIEIALRHNLHGGIHLMRACFARSGGVRKLIMARTPGELSGMNVYAASKAAAWCFAQTFANAYGWPIQGAMIFQAYGAGQPEGALIPAALAAAQRGEDFPMTSGAQEKDWIYVADVAAGLVRGVEMELDAGISFDLGTGQPTPVGHIVARIYALVARGGHPRPGLLPDRPGEAAAQIANAARTAALLGWQPTFSLEEGLRQMISEKGQKPGFYT